MRIGNNHSEKIVFWLMWKEEKGKLVCEIKFKDFIEAFGFLVQVAMLSEKANHHPEINCVYNKVKLTLFTHDEGKITSKDKQLAKEIEIIMP